ncbi:restriction endonuclease [Sphingobium estronivorans]|uniref:restriction endonuclease n=1 Tax=Sphingobium estronivorans TaxID=1577690 RepID=UPI0013C31B3C|nr:restriction endonuclease [Sphingobium estronivorans]
MPAATSLSEMFTDWGGFEQFVAELHRTGSVSVEHNVTLIGRSGASRQIDVLVRHKEGLYEHLIVVECKFRKSPIKREQVDAMATTIREVGASRGVIFSTCGFQSGAIREAAHQNISLYVVRPLEDDEWGKPGRHIDLWLHLISISIGNFKVPGSLLAGPPPNGPFALSLDATKEGRSSRTPLKILASVIHRSARGGWREWPKALF